MEQGDDGGKRWGIIGSSIVGLDNASVTTARTEGKQATPHLNLAGRSQPATYFCWSCRQKILPLQRILSTISGLANHLCSK